MILLPLTVGIVVGAILVLLVGIFFFINEIDEGLEAINDELINWRD